MRRAIAFALLAACAAGCGSSPAFTDEPERRSTDRGGAPVDDGSWTAAPDDHATPFALGETWIGRVACRRGELIVALHVIDLDPPHLRVLVEFEDVARETKGLFEASGQWQPEYREIELFAERPLRMPEGASTFDLRGRVTLNERVFIGVVDGRGDGCGMFYLRAVR